ncbi:potassium channel family protein [Laedolimicola ammoniilytica]|uniref:TrkA family potassium uptake protein n=1 Tax=Laedolimicola ammoniilytica TaxID=2981771 RepID=A0ABT2RZM7_9FIRM|nr:TrkA family potassium uptake protein [Laedolimicola ammoniilytica]MCU6697766.1 TrkA family potassium uptake protein [Laedolimicola ammoniilytica]
MKKKKDSSIFGIIGLGRFGTALAITLAEAGKEVIVVDQNEEKVKAMRQYTEYAFVCDNLSKEALSEVGIQNCDTVVVCIGSKIDTSILTTLNVVSLGVPRVISKATSQDQGAVLEKIGAEVVYPERDMATRLGKRLISGNFLDFIFLDNDIEIQQVPVSDSLVGKTIREINIRKKYSLNIIAIEHQQDTIIEFAPDYEFLKEDIIVVIGKLQNIRKFERAFS